MKHYLASIAAAVTLGLAAGPALAGDADICLDCHEPAEDWEGMSPEEILADAKNPDIKRHADNADLSDEQLKAMIAELLAQ
ncbi:MAG: hypothetical protein ACPG1A_00325 [Halioglobus sp.]